MFNWSNWLSRLSGRVVKDVKKVERGTAGCIKHIRRAQNSGCAVGALLYFKQTTDNMLVEAAQARPVCTHDGRNQPAMLFHKRVSKVKCLTGQLWSTLANKP